MMEPALRRSRKARKDEGYAQTKQTQALALSLISFIFVVYACGFLSTVMSLPPINPKEALSMYNNFAHGDKKIDSIDFNKISNQRGVGLNIAKGGIVVNEDNEDNEEEADKDLEVVDKSDYELDTKEEHSQNFSQVPTSKWPVSATRDRGEWFEMPHPGDEDIKIKVPPFWSAPVHNGTLMTRSLAMSIGTCAKADPRTGSFQIGEKCPLKDRTIFVAIASYRDWQCRYTVESIFTRAKYPHRIRVGVVDQIVDGDDICDDPIDPCEDKPDQALCKYIDQVDNFVTDAPLSVGPVFARHLGHRLYRGEYYAMQSDAHITFTQGKFSLQ